MDTVFHISFIDPDETHTKTIKGTEVVEDRSELRVPGLSQELEFLVKNKLMPTPSSWDFITRGGGGVTLRPN